MRDRSRRTVDIPRDPTATPKRRDAKTSNSTDTISHRATIVVPSLPDVVPYTLLEGVWKPAHTNALLDALGDVGPLVTRTARSIGKQQVGFDGLISLGGPGVLEVAATPRAMLHALQLYNLLLLNARKRGGEVSAKDGTVIRLRGESIRIRLRESVDRREDTRKDSIRSATHVPTGRLSFTVVAELGGNCKTPVADANGVEHFLEKVSRLIDRLPRLRAHRHERNRRREEEWARIQERLRREEDERRQWREQQHRFDQLTNDIEQWDKAERVRAYAAAVEARLSKNGAIGAGSKIDGWLRWMHWYADRLDPITRPDGPNQRPD
jgi:hypothetical protein